MSDKKKDPIVFILPESYKDREFAIAFDKHVEDIKSAFALDMEAIALKPQEPVTGIRAMLAPFDGYPLNYRILNDWKPKLD